MWKYTALILGLITGHAHAHTHSAPDKVLNRIEQKTVITPVVRHSPADLKQTLCLALGLYHEARGESWLGQRAVGHVILNRIRESGSTICHTLWEYGQFQWTKRSVDRLVPEEESTWIAMQHHAVALLRNDPDNTHGANMFYNPRICHPTWARHGRVTARYGKHVFVRL